MGRVLQIIGYKNAGKTTLIEKLLTRLIKDDFHVATIKHHGHGGTPDGNRDSERFYHLGAAASIVEGAGLISLHAHRSSWRLMDLIHIQMAVCKPSLILVEGWKQESFSKVVILRNEADLALLELENICCVITCEPLTDREISPYPTFLRGEEGFFPFIEAFLAGKEDDLHCTN